MIAWLCAQNRVIARAPVGTFVSGDRGPASALGGPRFCSNDGPMRALR